MSHVLEHLYDLNRKVLFLNQILQSNGKIFIEVPNVQNPKVKQLSSTTFHYWFFNKENLISLFSKYGYKVIRFGIFGKDKYMEELEPEEFIPWKKDIDNGLSSFKEMPLDHERAFYLRILLEK